MTRTASAHEDSDAEGEADRYEDAVTVDTTRAGNRFDTSFRYFNHPVEKA